MAVSLWEGITPFTFKNHFNTLRNKFDILVISALYIGNGSARVPLEGDFRIPYPSDPNALIVKVIVETLKTVKYHYHQSWFLQHLW